MISGVYKIENIKNGRIYIGSAANGFTKRWQKHKSDLKLNKHRNQRLQKAFNKHGEESFKYKILARCPKEYVLRLEQYFIDTLNPFYNICRIAGSSLGVKRTDEYKDKLRMAKVGVKMSEETREKARLRMMGNTLTKGATISRDVVEKRRLKQIGQKRSDEFKRKISSANTGRVLSEHSRNKIAASKMVYEYVIKNIQTNEVVKTNNLKAFTIKYNLHEGHLNDTLKGKNIYGRQILQHKGYKLIEKTSIQ